ncbi:XrtA/PEP-CTERM system exopolysaccharide export protein [Caenispirillum bisanense]|uniref:XrtA/PEP-CTERM system exopolysaccharide export protein n=1 Tax=Caenispirillum bisanense TaxID=414052 RepID=UPI0031DA274B
MTRHSSIFKAAATALVLAVSGCSSSYVDAPDVPPATDRPTYVIGPGDGLQIFVWRNPDLSTSVPVRPDGRISIPLVSEMTAAGKTPPELAADLEEVLGEYVQSPSVTVIVTTFSGPFDQQVRIVGEATQPQALPYRDKMTVLDAMISVGGLTDYAAGNRAVLVREMPGGGRQQYRVRIDDLLERGDISANVDLLPGDIIIVPQSWF